MAREFSERDASYPVSFSYLICMSESSISQSGFINITRAALQAKQRLEASAQMRIPPRHHTRLIANRFQC